VVVSKISLVPVYVNSPIRDPVITKMKAKLREINAAKGSLIDLGFIGFTRI